MTILVYCGSEMPARACRRPDVELRDPNGQRQSKKPFNRAPTAIKKQYKFYVRQPDVATFKLGNLSSLMQCSGRRAYNELFFFFAGSSGSPAAQLTTFVGIVPLPGINYAQELLLDLLICRA